MDDRGRRTVLHYRGGILVQTLVTSNVITSLAGHWRCLCPCETKDLKGILGFQHPSWESAPTPLGSRSLGLYNNVRVSSRIRENVCLAYVVWPKDAHLSLLLVSR